jgi:hypothetical protein
VLIYALLAIVTIVQPMAKQSGLMRMLKKGIACFDKLSTSGSSSTISTPDPFALSLSKGERRVFQHPPREAPLSCASESKEDGKRGGVFITRSFSYSASPGRGIRPEPPGRMTFKRGDKL